jgi:hypothetical protein
MQAVQALERPDLTGLEPVAHEDHPRLRRLCPECPSGLVPSARRAL